jgi:hypothetical protein
MSDKYSNFLFADPSMVYGVARLLDFEGNFVEYNRSATPAQADARAMFCDWAAVGSFLDDSIRIFSEKPSLESSL